MDNLIETKKCSRCGKELPLYAYNKCKRNKDGLSTYCKKCAKEDYKKKKAKGQIDSIIKKLKEPVEEITFTCKNCGKQFHINRAEYYAYKRNGYIKQFCSKDCFHQFVHEHKRG